MIAALFRRIRARRQIRWGIGYIRSRYGDEHDAARQRLLDNWEAYRP